MILFCRYKMSSDQFTHRLVLPSVRLSDAGEYTAVAGSNMSKANLGVEGRDVKISEPSDRNVSVSSHILDGLSPVDTALSGWVTVLFTPSIVSSEVGGEVDVSHKPLCPSSQEEGQDMSGLTTPLLPSVRPPHPEEAQQKSVGDLMTELKY